MGRRLCYKRWYGVQSHRCLQFTPSLQFCNLRCIFCWRIHTSERFSFGHAWDSPDLILEAAIEAQQRLLTGFKANPHVAEKLFEESRHPTNVAVSLDGEPTLYPFIGSLIRKIAQRRMSSFLVTNGTMPDRLEEMVEHQTEPTNLYLSLYGPDARTYDNVTNPMVPDVWQRVLASLRLMDQFKHARTIVRLTLVKGLNMHDPVGYSKLAMEGRPDIIELKGYSWLGESKQRLPISAMPYQSEINEFAREIAKATGYELLAEDQVSRVALLVRDVDTADLSLDLHEG
jgi:tRNA wybutosine-synthesizing protein 1